MISVPPKDWPIKFFLAEPAMSYLLKRELYCSPCGTHLNRDVMPATTGGNIIEAIEGINFSHAEIRKCADNLNFLNLKLPIPLPQAAVPGGNNSIGRSTKKAGQYVISLSGTRHYKSDVLVSSEASSKECQLLRNILNQIEGSADNCREIYQISLNLIKLTHDPVYRTECSEIYSMALKSHVIFEFIQSYFKSIHSKFFDNKQPNRRDCLLSPHSEPTFAIPFDERRDSFPSKEDESRMLLPRWVYDNRQKLRDGLVFVLQEFLPTKSTNERQICSRIKEMIFSKMVYLNGDWLAELVLGEYLKWIGPKHSVSRMDLLEQRLAPKQPIPSREECFEFFSLLLRHGDCLSLSLGLCGLIPKKIGELEEICCHGALRRNEIFKDSFVKIYELVKLFKFISNELLENSTDPVLKELTLKASNNRCLLLHLKWIWEEKTLLSIIENASFGPISYGSLQLLEIRAKPTSSINNLFIDTDNALDHSFIIEQMRPDLVKALMDSFVNCPLLSSVVYPDNTLPSPRKIQPTPLPFPPKDEASVRNKTQLELRKWFWWQHPNEYELVKGILPYLKHNGGFPKIDLLLKDTLNGLLSVRSLPQQVTDTIICLATEELKLDSNSSNSN